MPVQSDPPFKSLQTLIKFCTTIRKGNKVVEVHTTITDTNRIVTIIYSIENNSKELRSTQALKINTPLKTTRLEAVTLNFHNGRVYEVLYTGEEFKCL